MSEPFSITSRTPSAYYDPGSQCLKTSQQSLLSEAPALLERLPDWGTTVAGALFALPTPERLTDARDGSASLPTPTTVDSHSSGRSRRSLMGGDTRDLTLREAVKLLPPQTSLDWGDCVECGHPPYSIAHSEACWGEIVPFTAEELAELGGATMPVPSPDGNEPSAGPHPHPPTTGNSPADSSNG